MLGFPSPASHQVWYRALQEEGSIGGESTVRMQYSDPELEGEASASKPATWGSMASPGRLLSLPVPSGSIRSFGYAGQGGPWGPSAGLLDGNHLGGLCPPCGITLRVKGWEALK